MAFSKRFPRTVKGSSYPEWVDIVLSGEEERIEEENAQKENVRILQQCVDDARLLLEAQEMATEQSDVVALACSLFEKRASHAVYWKERRCREKFETAA